MENVLPFHLRGKELVYATEESSKFVPLRRDSSETRVSKRKARKKCAVRERASKK